MDPSVLVEHATSLCRTEATLQGAEPSALLLFGPHAAGTARPDSDVDVFLLVRGIPSPADRTFALHHRAIVSTTDGTVAIEMPVGTEASLAAAISANHPVLTPIAASARVLYEREPGRVTPLIEQARTAVDRAIDGLVENLSERDADIEWALCRSEYRDLGAITASALTRAPMAGWARVVEALGSFYDDVLCQLVMRHDDAVERRRLADVLYRARGLQAIRFLDPARYAVEPWFATLLERATELAATLHGPPLAEALFDELDLTARRVLALPLHVPADVSFAATVRRG